MIITNNHPTILLGLHVGHSPDPPTLRATFDPYGPSTATTFAVSCAVPNRYHRAVGSSTHSIAWDSIAHHTPRHLATCEESRILSTAPNYGVAKLISPLAYIWISIFYLFSWLQVQPHRAQHWQPILFLPPVDFFLTRHALHPCIPQKFRHYCSSSGFQTFFVAAFFCFFAGFG